MANNYLAILADIKNKMDSIPDIGVVHDYERWASSWDQFISLFKSQAHNQIRGWEITRGPVSEHLRGTYFRHHLFRIRGYMSLDDAQETDKTFQQLIEEVCNTFRNAQGGASWFYGNGDAPENSPAQVEINEPRMFGSVLCHYAEILLSVTERIIT